MLNRAVRSIPVKESSGPNVEYTDGKPYQTVTVDGVRVSLTFKGRRENFAGH